MEIQCDCNWRRPDHFANAADDFELTVVELLRNHRTMQFEDYAVERFSKACAPGGGKAGCRCALDEVNEQEPNDDAANTRYDVTLTMPDGAASEEIQMLLEDALKKKFGLAIAPGFTCALLRPPAAFPSSRTSTRATRRNPWDP